MVVTYIQGGLGNQLFQYASGYALAKMMNTDLYVCTNKGKNVIFGYRLDKLNISRNVQLNSSEMNCFIKLLSVSRTARKVVELLQKPYIDNGDWRFVIQKNSLINIDISCNKNIFLDGYWQNPQNFKEYISELCNEFKPNFKLSYSCQKWEKKIKESNSVSIHIRRGDYLEAKNKNYLIKQEYYDSAIAYIKNKYDDVEFFVFSDDKLWVKEYYPQFSVVELDSENSDIEEMYLMSCCKNNINANSTFSWWGAMLNCNPNKIVVNPERPWNPEMLPEGWIIGKNSSYNNSEKILFNKND